MEVFRSRRELALSRKLALGRAASYRTLSWMTGVSATTIRAVLLDEERGVPTDRTRVIERVMKALDAIESDRPVG